MTSSAVACTTPPNHPCRSFVYLLADPQEASAAVALSSIIAPAATSQALFAASGTLPGVNGDAVPPSTLLASNNNTVAALAWDLGVVPASGAAVAATGVFFVDVRAASFERRGRNQYHCYLFWRTIGCRRLLALWRTRRRSLHTGAEHTRLLTPSPSPPSL